MGSPRSASRRRCVAIIGTVGIATAALAAPGSAVVGQMRPDGRTGYHRVFDVAAISPSTAWAVGSRGLKNVSRVKHWDGDTWVAAKAPAIPFTGLAGVAAISADDVWAVGASGGPVSEHWDGTTWSRVSMPAGNGFTTAVTGVSGSASDDVWAVGWHFVDEETDRATVILHWDGRAWSEVSAQQGGAAAGSLSSVVSISPKNAWAVGFGESGRGLIEHWNGRRWTVSSTAGGALNDIDAISASDIWAVGGSSSTYVEHWDGHSWTVVSSPNGSGKASYLDSVSAVSADDVWASGSSGDLSFEPAETLIEHWDGSDWSVVPSPSPGHGTNALNAISADAADDAWAVGYFADGDQPDQVNLLFLHWDGTAWTHHHLP